MKKIRYIKIRFKGEIEVFEIPAFRGVILSKVSQKDDLFHNHEIDGRSIYRYPLIQYKRQRKQPVLICLDEGVDEVYKVFSNASKSVNTISGKEFTIEVDHLEMNYFTFQVWEESFHYRVRNWLPLSESNYKEFLQIETLKEKLDFLEKKMIGNIVSMAKGLEWTIDKQIKVNITSFNEPVWTKFKNVRLLSFDLDFTSNIAFPQHLGIGKGAGLGYGIITKKTN